MIGPPKASPSLPQLLAAKSPRGIVPRMHRPLMTVILSLLLLCLPLSLAGCDDVKAEIEEVLDQYTAAKRSGDAETVLKLIDPKNIEHYDFIVQTAKSGLGTQIARLNALERLQIGFLRATLKPEELAELDGRKWVKLRIARRYEITKGDGPELSLTDVKHRRPRASGALVVEGIITDVRL